jgi:hypothetical protein
MNILYKYSYIMLYTYNSQNCRKKGAVFGSNGYSHLVTGDTLHLACPLEGTEPAQHVN